MEGTFSLLGSEDDDDIALVVIWGEDNTLGTFLSDAVNALVSFKFPLEIDGEGVEIFLVFSTVTALFETGTLPIVGCCLDKFFDDAATEVLLFDDDDPCFAFVCVTVDLFLDEAKLVCPPVYPSS